ncbi:hypothetical protein M9H77_04340 [Catharanthus roseus]|uniref:Uncharacterized protein n=1 Tax=Catharanthus roseus TaxID=4058 RepID=A0ACC0CE38_CATRO|nr:hypothetical protein M9H77_04340 [Catharanthus roseus]
MVMCENWQVFKHDWRHNHALGVYTHSHVQVAKLTEEQLIQIEQFRKSHVPHLPRKYTTSLRKIKKNRMQRQNMVEEVLCLSAIRDYTVFYRNREDSNMLSDIVNAYLTSIEMLRTWSYVLIMDTTYKTNKCYLQIDCLGVTFE